MVDKRRSKQQGNERVTGKMREYLALSIHMDIEWYDLDNQFVYISILWRFYQALIVSLGGPIAFRRHSGG